MPAERYYSSALLISGGQLDLTETEFHHLTHVMRASLGDSVEVVDGKGSLATCEVSRMEKKKAILNVARVEHTPLPSVKVILAQAMPRMNRLDFIVEKGTELGMTELWLFPGERGERKELTAHQLERLKSITIGAMKQCGRLYLPEVSWKPALQKWNRPEESVFFGDVNPEAPSLYNVDILSKALIFFIGPESGLTEKEENILRSWEGTGVKIHSDILRTDTAALAALAVLHLKSLQ